MTLAHVAVGRNELWAAWSLDPLVFASLALAAAAYLVGLRRLGGPTGRPIGTGRVVSFFGGLVVIVVALVSPLSALADTLFSAHMVQHLALILCAAPLLTYGAPALPFLLALPPRLRRRVQRFRHKQSIALPLLAAPVAAWTAHTAAMWAWHLPSLYEAGLRNEALHALEHLAFLSTALAVWAVVIPAPRTHARYGVAAGLLFATALQSGALGAILTFATAVLYPIHALGAGLWGLTALQDQQLAGVIMWIPAGAIYFTAIGVLAARWLKEASPADVQDPVLVGTDER